MKCLLCDMPNPEEGTVGVIIKTKKTIHTVTYNSLLYRTTCFDPLPGHHQVAVQLEIKMFTIANGRRILLDNKNDKQVLLYASVYS